MNYALILMIIEFIIFLLCAFFFSSTETAITAITRTQYKLIKKNCSKKNKKIAALIEKKDEIITATLIGTNFINTASSSLITAFVLNIYGKQYIPLAAAITTILIIIFAEVLPKAIATDNAVEVIKISYCLLEAIRIILKPIIYIFSLISKFIISLFLRYKPNRGENFSEGILETLINISLADGTFQTGEHALIKRAVQLHNLNLQSIMTKKNDIISCSINESFNTILNIFQTTKFSRIPIYDTDKDNIIGLIHYKDLLFNYKSGNSLDIKKILLPAFFIPTTANIFSTIKMMGKRKKNMVFIIDEYGLLSGLITIDDISGAIFGSIQDEYAKPKTNPLKHLKIIANKQVRIPAAIFIVDFNKIFNTNLHSNYYNTIGGLILETAGYLPAIGESITISGIEFIIEKIEKNKIASLVANLANLMVEEQPVKSFL